MSTISLLSEMTRRVHQETGHQCDMTLIVSPKVLHHLTDNVRIVGERPSMPRANLVIETENGTVTVRSDA